MQTKKKFFLKYFNNKYIIYTYTKTAIKMYVRDMQRGEYAY